MKQKNIFLMVKKYAQLLITSFQMLSQTLKYLIIVIINGKKTHSPSTTIQTFEKHPTILNIKKGKLDSVFSFRKTTQEKVLKVTRDLNTNKRCQTSDSPTKIIILNSNIFSNLI